MAFEREVDTAAAHWARFYGVRIDPALVHGVIERESMHGRHPSYVRQGGKVREPSGGYSYGVMQVRDQTARTELKVPLKLEALIQPAIGIWYGVQYLAKQLRAFPGNPLAAISAYNAGPGNARKGIQRGRWVNPEYVGSVLNFWRRFLRSLPQPQPRSGGFVAAPRASTSRRGFWSLPGHGASG